MAKATGTFVSSHHHTSLQLYLSHNVSPLTYTTSSNRGSMGEEVVDENFRFTNARRRSNSFSHHNLSDFKTKFEVNEMDPLYDESLHGPVDEENGDDLSKTDSTESVHSV